MTRDIDNPNADPTMTAPFPKLDLAVKPDVETGFAEVLAGVLGIDQVAVGSHFFDDLDADSMLMARFCARVRKRDDLPTVSMKDIYRCPTISSLAVAFAPIDVGGTERVGEKPSEPAASDLVAEAPVAQTPAGSTARYVWCGVAQALIVVAYGYATATVLNWGLSWLDEPVDLPTLYLRALRFSTATLLGMSLLPVLAKWVLIGRFTETTIRVWSPAYLRFWCVKTLIRANPLVLFAGSPIYTLYLRLLGAKIGKGVTVYSPTPVCTDLLTIGAHTVVRKDAQLPGYRAVAGVIEIGPITLGEGVIVGEQTVIDINSSLGDGARLGHSSAVHAGQHIGVGEFWHGSPARPSGATYPDIDPARCGSLRRLMYSLWQLVVPLGVYAPVLATAPVALGRIHQLAPLLDSGPPMLTHWAYYHEVALHTAALALGLGIVNFLVVMIVPRILNLGLKPGRVYPLFGFRYWLHRTITRRTNAAFFMELVGDSSYVLHYLRALGYDLGRYVQTGSNFGAGVKHDNPYLCTVGPGTMVADGLSMINTDYSATSFRLNRVSVGERSFLGNGIAYPSQSTVGANTLLGTMTMVPIDGPIRENTGLLGAPSFEIPRTVDRDTQLEVTDDSERRRLLRAKNRHNTITIIMFLIVRWIPVFLAVLLGESAALNVSLGPLPLLAMTAVESGAGLLFLVVLQRVANRWVAVVPDGCSIYDKTFWRHERYWKLPAQGWMNTFNGTPFKPLIWRALGVHIGRRVFDDGFAMPEKSLVTIGDDCTLNAGSGVQCHSQEDGAFKSDRTTLGNSVTLGIGAFIHYGVTIGEGAVLAPETFVMKGEELPPHTRWIGNPAALAVTTATAYPPAPAALPADSAHVAAALATRPRAVVEWDGQGWSFPNVEHYTEPADGPVTRLRIDRPGTLRLTGSGDNLRIELIPDDRDTPLAPLIRLPLPLPLPSELHALHNPDLTPEAITSPRLAKPYAAALILLAITGSTGVLLATTHDLPFSTLISEANTAPGFPPPTSPTNPIPGTAQALAPDTAPDEEPDDALPPGKPAPTIHNPVLITHHPVPVIHKPVGAPKPRTVPTPAVTPPNATTNPDNNVTYNSDGTITYPDGTTSGSTKKSKKSKKTTMTG